ncbi:hypothetical protein POX_e06837 [Penicillium oxalicum]|uniref:hypothetical protein n=1 Tax=Penicillium oxalicum TaxID=69781 RepID=UPI0020B654B2|nr:hypothetical protein POX_e06837 [Penicillium oxalicum]KAI2788816.1 hypothetical protein POX_e06837 [Penicillium oxalicum]
MQLVRSIVFSLLAASSLAIPRNIDVQKPAIQSGPTQYSLKQPPLTTPWTDQVGTNPWPEYPRPQMQRTQWQNLNGIWQYRRASGLTEIQNPPFGQNLDQEVLIPSCLESGLSGIQGSSTLYSWFLTHFEVPSSWNGQQILLNFDAVDYEATVFVNGQNVGFNRGGYYHFTLDVTGFVKPGKSNELLVFVHDPTDSGDYVIPIGKQTLRPSHIFYTPCSGIWQTVWIEPAPVKHVTQLDVDADMNGQVNMTVHTSSPDDTGKVQVTVHDGDRVIASHEGPSNRPFQFQVDSVKLWSPDAPNLYSLTVKVDQDQIESYTGFRTIGKGTVNGIVRPLLNGEFVFMFGTLDQGYWPDGIYVPPTKEAMIYDLKLLKRLGFNSVRKHIKIEPQLFYRACDEIGLLVIQDMPSLRPLQGVLPNAAQQVEFARQLDLLVNQLKSFPSIATWVIYNEGWGQITSYYPEFELTDRVQQLDPTRLVDSTTGWIDHGAGDFSSLHPKRIGLQGEFGGLGHNVSIEHLWNVQAAINTIDQTYELDETIEIWNYRSHIMLAELQDQTKRFACSGGIWTQTTDVEGEVNGLVTYDRRLVRADETQWKADIQALYDTAAAHGNARRGRL